MAYRNNALRARSTFFKARVQLSSLVEKGSLIEYSPILSLLILWDHESQMQVAKLADLRAIRREHHAWVFLLYELHHLSQAIKEDDHSGVEATIV